MRRPIRLPSAAMLRWRRSRRIATRGRCAETALCARPAHAAGRIRVRDARGCRKRPTGIESSTALEPRSWRCSWQCSLPMKHAVLLKQRAEKAMVDGHGEAEASAPEILVDDVGGTGRQKTR